MSSGYMITMLGLEELAGAADGAAGEVGFAADEFGAKAADAAARAAVVEAIKFFIWQKYEKTTNFLRIHKY